MSTGSLMRLKPIKDYLKSKFIFASDQWITNTLNTNSGITDTDAYKLWLNSDITKISAKNETNLPKDCIEVGNKDKKTVYGKYALQVNALEDISRPKILSAADALEEEHNSSEDNSETENENKLFKKQKPKKQKKETTRRGQRMLSMMLTDGLLEYKAIEYQPIDSLTGLAIGSKLLISGPFDVYNAVIFLAPKHVTILGGSIPLDKDGSDVGPLGSVFSQNRH